MPNCAGEHMRVTNTPVAVAALFYAFRFSMLIKHSYVNDDRVAMSDYLILCNKGGNPVASIYPDLLLEDLLTAIGMTTQGQPQKEAIGRLLSSKAGWERT